MKNTLTIKNSGHFTRAIKRGKVSSDKFLVVYILNNRLPINRIGISIGKKVGKSVIRNKVKRLIRENYRAVEDLLKMGVDIVFIPRPISNSATLGDINKSIINNFKKHDLFLKKWYNEKDIYFFH